MGIRTPNEFSTKLKEEFTQTRNVHLEPEASQIKPERTEAKAWCACGRNRQGRSNKKEETTRDN